MTRWIGPAELAELVQRDIKIRGAETLYQVILREPESLIPVTEPGIPPVDVPTCEVRRARWHEGRGPTLVGVDEFMTVLTSLTEPACAVTVQGTRISRPCTELCGVHGDVVHERPVPRAKRSLAIHDH